MHIEAICGPWSASKARPSRHLYPGLVGRTNFLRQALQVGCDERIALAVVQYRKAPGVAEGDEVRLSGEEVDEEGLCGGAHLAHAGEVINLAAQLGLDQAGPDEVGGAVSPLLKVGEEAVDDVGFGGEEVYGVHLGVGLAAVLDALDGWGGWSAEGAGGSGSDRAAKELGGAPTGDVIIENVIFLDGIVDDSFGCAVDDQAFPLGSEALVSYPQTRELGVLGRSVGRGPWGFIRRLV